MKILYRIIYQPTVNFIIRYIVSFINLFLAKKLIIPLNGIIPFHISKDVNFLLEMNESSPACSVYWNDPASFEFTPIFTELIKDCDTFLDIGANLGFYSFLAQKSNPSILVHAFEPSNGAFHFLSKNIIHNKTNNIKVHKLAMSDRNGDISFFEEINPKYPYLKYFLSGISNTTNTESMRASAKYTVPADTLDDFVDKFQLPSLDIIKMDTEGTEYLIIKSGLTAIRKFQPIVICEVLDQDAANQLNDILLKEDYLIYQYTDKGLKLLQLISFGDNEKDRNFFFIPNSKVELINKFT